MAAATAEFPLWRSLLYVPASNPRFIERAHARGADGVILDLEDGVAPAAKDAARAALAAAVPAVGSGGSDVLVRINGTGADLDADVEAAVHPGLAALVVPKVERAEDVRRVVVRLERFERARGLAHGEVRIVLIVESAAALLDARALAGADSRIVALTLGGEDFALATGMQPGEDTLAVPKQLCLIAARAAGVMPLGLLGSIADYSDLKALALVAVRSRRFGFEGGACVHPSNVPVLNAAFTPNDAEVARARRILEAWEQGLAAGTGAVTVDGRMVDLPVVERARRVHERRRRIAEREKKRNG